MVIAPVDVSLPDRTRFPSRGPSGGLQPVSDDAVRAALAKPLGLVRIGETVLLDSHVLSMGRLLLVNRGQSFSAGDRELMVLRPPVWDSSATQALLDAKNDALFSSDFLGAFIPRPAEVVTDIPEAAFAENFQTCACALSPGFTSWT